MDLKSIFGAFSRREPSASQTFVTATAVTIPETTRNRVLLWCSDLFGGDDSLSGGDYRSEFWLDIHRRLQYRHGRHQLSASHLRATNESEDAAAFVFTCDTPEFLDFLEDIFQAEPFWRHQNRAKELVSQLNQLLRVDDIPFFVTDMVVEEAMSAGPFGGRMMPTTRVREYPRAVLREAGPLQQEVIEPVLQLLGRKDFAAADSEYLAALEDLRKGDYDDCLTKCCSSFESAMKVICELKRWPYRKTDTAGPLIKTILEHTSLDSYFETTLLIVATLRNRLGSAHGAGLEDRSVSRQLASYAVQTTGTSILLLVRESGL